jgi:hypothetical protein
VQVIFKKTVIDGFICGLLVEHRISAFSAVFSFAAVQSAWWSCLQLIALGEVAFFLVYLSLVLFYR